MNLLKNFIDFIKKENLFNSKDKLLLAVSGGVDSVVLCELCKQAGYDFVIAHCNFQLRGSESDRDEDFVRKLAETYAVDVFVKSFDTKKYAEENKLNIQVAARALRYDWFNELAAAKNIQHILTAHHANDNMETLLMNFFKGTGINGLKAVLPKHDHIIRPLLFAKKEELLAFTAGHKLAFVEDSSNASDKYTRNYFRNQLIPGLQKVFPQVEENLMNNIERFREIELLYNQATTLAKKKLLEPRGNEMHIPVLKLLKTEPLNTIIYEIIKDFGFTAHQTAETMTLLKSESGKYIQSSTHRIIKNRNWLIISPNQTIAADNIIIEEKDKQVEFKDGKLHLELLSTPNPKLQTPNHTAQLNADNIKFPMLLRKWKSGDYFYPLGMQKKKKLSRFFIDQKLSLTQKEKIWVIEMNKKIIWVVGLRIDDRFKITGETKTVLQVTWSVAE
jgi:tRNA(Ile)-lysidine synthase